MVETLSLGRFHLQQNRLDLRRWAPAFLSSHRTLFTVLWMAAFASVFIWQRSAVVGRFSFFNSGVVSRPIPRLRPVAFNLTDFGGVGDGVTVNTVAFERAVFAISKLGKKGGGQLNVPPGRWLTAPFNLTSHMTLFLAEDAEILAIENEKFWPLMPPLPSYGYGREHPGPRFGSFIHGQNLKDVVITGHNGTINGQGQTWWKKYRQKLLNNTRGPLVQIMWSSDILISNITLRDSPFWTVHPYDCKNVTIRNVTILAPIFQAPNTDGIDPVAKSAQFPLHVWLPDAMEGPTPISALIHVATMVAAGIFLVARLLPLFIVIPYIMNLISLIGIITVFLGATLALAQQDISDSSKDIINCNFCNKVNLNTSHWMLQNVNLDYQDSCEDMVIEDCFISVGDDAIAIKSGWDQYGIAYGRPSANILIRNLVVRSMVSAGISIGSEMSGGISNVTIENLLVWSSRRAVRMKTAPGRGGYIRNINYRNLTFDNVRVGIVIKTDYNEHPDEGYDPKALPILKDISFIGVHGQGVRVPVRIHGSEEIPVRNVTFQDISVGLTYKKKHIFQCSFVQGRVIGTIFPSPCENLDLYDEQGQLVKRSASQNVTDIDYDL